jgi:8-oxo-dGTP pyrophosphatase MutT (NUDIX family)
VTARPPAPTTGDGASSEPSSPIPAATVVLLRPAAAGLEVLLTRRPSTMAFGPDLHVFPGGRLDASDGDPAALTAAGLPEEAAATNLGLHLDLGVAMSPASALAHHVAAVRETAEETGIRITARDLIPLTRWVTPISMTRRFDVRFFAAVVPRETEVDGASAEVVDARWLTPGEALRAAAAGDVSLWQPTFVTLQQLDGLHDAAAIRSAFMPGAAAGGPTLEPVRPGLHRVDAAWAAGIPGRRSVGWLVGERELVAVNPADPTGETLAAIMAHVASVGGRLSGVVIADLVPERHAGVEMLAHGLGLPVVVPAGAVPWAPYPVTELGLQERLPFGDPPWTLGEVLAL